MDDLARWDDLRSKSDRELLAIYREALVARGLSKGAIDANVSAFRKTESREDRIYFIVSSERIVVSRKRKGLVHMEQALEVLRAIAQFYREGGSGAMLSGSALLLDDDRPLLERIDDAIANLEATKSSVAGFFGGR